MHQDHLYESSESSRESRDVGQEILKALKHFATSRDKLEETLKDLQRHTTSFIHAFIVISDYEEEQLENKTTKKAEWSPQLVEIRQPVACSSKLVGGFFKIEVGSHDIPVIIPTKYHSKYIMSCQGNEQVEEGNSPTKVT